MKILSLEAQNFARLKAVTIEPKGGVVKITGANKQGKTSVLAAIETALRGKAGSPAEPIRRGAAEAILTLDLGEVHIERTIKRGDPGPDAWSLKVTRADGAKIARTPQAVIDAFYSALTVDPLKFSRADPKAQVEMLKRLVPNFDFAKNAATRQAAYDERTIANRRAKEQRTIALNTVLPATRPEPVDVEAIGKKFDESTRHNAKIGQANTRREMERVTASNNLERAKRLREEANKLEVEANDLLGAIEDSENESLKLIDVADLQQEMAHAVETNRVVRLFEARDAQVVLAKSFEQESSRLTEEIEELDEKAKAAIASANLPAGLSFDETGVYLNDLPFAQASSAETMQVACAVAMALSPDLKVILVDGAERLDSREMGVLEGLAKQGGYDLWLTIVDESGKTGFVIEDGELK